MSLLAGWVVARPRVVNPALRADSIPAGVSSIARQSAGLIAETLSPDIEPVQADGLNPNDDPSVIVGDIEQISDNVLIATHMPFVSRLCSALLTGATQAEFASIPGTLICLERTEGQWRLAYMLRPDFL